MNEVFAVFAGVLACLLDCWITDLSRCTLCVTASLHCVMLQKQCMHAL